MHPTRKQLGTISAPGIGAGRPSLLLLETGITGTGSFKTFVRTICKIFGGVVAALVVEGGRSIRPRILSWSDCWRRYV